MTQTRVLPNLLRAGNAFATLSSAIVFFFSIITFGIGYYGQEGGGRISGFLGFSGHDLSSAIMGISAAGVALALLGMVVGIRFAARRWAGLLNGLLQTGFGGFTLWWLLVEPGVLTAIYLIVAFAAALLCFLGAWRGPNRPL
jgi:hypothetical protein